MSAAAPNRTERLPPWVLLRQVFANRRMAALLLLGFSSGLPLALTAGTLQAWLTVEGVSLKAIGFATLIGQAYVFKFAWAPGMDRIQPPSLVRALGRRRGWLLLMQALLAASLAAIAIVGIPAPTATSAWPGLDRLAGALGIPAGDMRLLPVGILAVAVAFFSASQDIVIDAYRTDLLPPEERGAGAAVAVLGYRLAMLVSGGLALWLAAEYLGWRGMYALMAGLMAVLMLATLFAPPTPGNIKAPRSLTEAVVEPAREFFARRGAVALLVAIVLYKLGDAFAGALSTTFLIRGAGYSPAEVGLVYKTMGIATTIVGALLGGAWLARLGLWRSLVWFGVGQGLSNLAYWALAVLPSNLALMAAAVGIENFTGGMGTAAFVAFLSALCDARFSATQFALLSALSAVGRVYVGPATGFLVEAWGWPHFYLLTVVASAPGVLMVVWLRRVIETQDRIHAPRQAAV
ncbi:MFS transporter [Thiomonas sp. FB-Cd]|uniref:MFS transporter n=1 Tax=Thiomonas sp. FB-Cd TaxID=1158292 RepID=UPI00068FF77F|nr:MFS transporter [Thiomonas sp. FB-Cd]